MPQISSANAIPADDRDDVDNRGMSGFVSHVEVNVDLLISIPQVSVASKRAPMEIAYNVLPSHVRGLVTPCALILT